VILIKKIVMIFICPQTDLQQHTLFWARLAVENGDGSLCGQLGEEFSRKLTDNLQLKPKKPELAAMLFLEQGGEQDLQRACNIYKALADQGSKLAQHNYASMALLGKGEVEDLQEAQKYFQKAANQGYVEAIIILQGIKDKISQEAEEKAALEESMEFILPSLENAIEPENAMCMEEHLRQKNWRNKPLLC
jgi:TPR repeat protein